MPHLITLEQTLASAIAAENAGNIAEADRLCDAALQAGQNYDALLVAARVASKQGNHAKTARHLKSAITLQPSQMLRMHLVIALKDAGDLEQAMAEAKEGLTKKPKDVPLLNLYGVLLKTAGRFHEAIEVFARVSKLDPKNISPWVNTGNTWVALDNPKKAIDFFFKATRLAPKEGEFQRLLGGCYLRLKDYDKAMSHIKHAIVLSPQNVQARIDLTRILMAKKEYDQALQEVELIIGQFPNSLEALRDKGVVLRLMGRTVEAKAVYEQILQKNPNHVDALISLGNLYSHSFGDHKAANSFYARAYSLTPHNPEIVAQYAECLRTSRYDNETAHLELAYKIICSYMDSSESLLRVSAPAQAVLFNSADYARLARLGNRRDLITYWVKNMVVSALHNQLGRVETLQDRIDLVEAHRAWGQQIEAEAAVSPISHVSPKLPKSRIRLGLMSSDLRNHAAASYISPLLEHYDRNRFEIFCYSFSTLPPDEIQEWIAKTVDHFNIWPDLPERQAAQRIASDGLDILFELGGTTHMNKVEVLAWRPAPVQASWLGYPHSCGLTSIDYLVVDPYTKPDRPELLIEKPLCLPETCVNIGRLRFGDIPINEIIPEKRLSGLAFGTMNNPYKYTPKVFAVWSRIMKEVPNSTFHFVRPEAGMISFRENILAQFLANGISSDRIKFTPIRGKHMPFYNEIDIALDPFPHTGGATTCEALWMGVPTVTLVGPTFYERISYSNLNNAGLGDLCAFDVESYVSITLALVKDQKRREDLRTGLRHQIRQNPLGQNERFVRNFEAQVEKILSEGRSS